MQVSVEPEATGLSVKVTGVANEISPRLPSGTSLTAAESENAPVPPGELTLTYMGFSADGVTAASSLVTVRVLDPLLFRNEPLELVKLAVMG